MRRFPTLLVATLLAAGGLLVLAEEASAQRNRGGGRGGWSGGYNSGSYGSGYRGGYNSGWYGSGYRGGYYDRYPGYGYGYGYGPGVTFGGRNWGVTVPFDSGYNYGYRYPGRYYPARPYSDGGYYAYPSDYAAQAPAQAQNAAEVEVRVPDPNAEVMFNGHRTAEMGRRRIFHTASLEPGYTYSYEVAASWPENGRMVTRKQTIQLQPGGRAAADFTAQEPAPAPSQAEEQEDQPRPPSPLPGRQQRPRDQQPAPPVP